MCWYPYTYSLIFLKDHLHEILLVLDIWPLQFAKHYLTAPSHTLFACCILKTQLKIVYKFQLCRSIYKELCLLHIYDQKWTTDIRPSLLVPVYALTASLLLIAYHSCTHLQATNNRILFLFFFLFCFFKEVSSLPVTNAQKVMKTNTFAILSQEHDWLGSSKFPHAASTEQFQPTWSREKHTYLQEEKCSNPQTHWKKGNSHKVFILYWGAVLQSQSLSFSFTVNWL